MLLRQSIIGLILCLLISSIQAGSKITFQYSGIDGGRKIQEQRSAHIGNGQVRVYGPNGSDRIDLVFDAGQKKFTVLDHRDRSYMILDEQGLGEMLGQAKTIMQQMDVLLQNMPESQRKQFEQMLGMKLSNSGNSAPLRHLKTDKRLHVAKIPCHVYSIMGQSKKESEICLANAEDLGLAADDLQTLLVMRDFGLKLMSDARSVLPFITIGLPDFENPDLQGFPLKGRDLSGKTGGQFSVLKISQWKDDARASIIPDNYKRRSLPSL